MQYQELHERAIFHTPPVVLHKTHIHELLLVAFLQWGICFCARYTATYEDEQQQVQRHCDCSFIFSSYSAHKSASAPLRNMNKKIDRTKGPIDFQYMEPKLNFCPIKTNSTTHQFPHHMMFFSPKSNLISANICKKQEKKRSARGHNSLLPLMAALPLTSIYSHNQYTVPTYTC